MRFSNGLLREALLDCQIAHMGQVRKYTGRPYWEHPYEVAGILVQNGITGEAVLCASLLHDVLEDTDMPEKIIAQRYGPRTFQMVVELTEVETEGNRAQRKKVEAHRLWQVSRAAQTIKCADLVSNTRDIAKHDPGFARVYLTEKEYVLSGLTKADERLLALAHRALLEAKATIA